MNILPFIAIFLIVLAIFSKDIGSNVKKVDLYHFYFSGFMKAERNARKMEEQFRFIKIYKAKDNKKTKPKPPPGGYIQEKLKIEMCNKRKNLEHSMASKINLFPLFMDSSPFQKPLMAFTHRMLCHLYKEILDEKTASLFLQAFIKKGKKTLQSKNQKWELIEILPQNPKINEISIKLFKGTRSYDLQKKEGYPPFEDFFIINPNDQGKPIQFQAAHEEILKILWGGKALAHILDEENKADLPEDKLKQILSSFNIPHPFEIVEYAYKGKWLKKKIIGEDKKSSILVFKKSPF